MQIRAVFSLFLFLWLPVFTNPGLAQEIVGKPLRIFTGHKKAIRAVAFSPDGQYVFTGSEDKTVKQWRVADEALVRTFAVGDLVRAMAVSSDGAYLLTTAGMAAKLWKVSNGQLVRTFKRHDWDVEAVAFSPDGDYVLTGASDLQAKLWQVLEQRLVRTFKVGGYVRAVAFSPDGRFVLAGSSDETVKMWSASSGHLLHKFKGHRKGVWAVAFSPDGDYALTGGDDHSAKLWDTENGELVSTYLTLDTHRKAVRAVAFSPDGAYLLTGSDDKTAALWDVWEAQVRRVFKAHTKRVRSVAFSPDGAYLLTGSDDKSALLWASGIREGTLTFDTQPPLVTLVEPKEGVLVQRPASGEIVLRGFITDNETVTDLTINGRAVLLRGPLARKEFEYHQPVGPVGGTFTFHLVASDEAGNRTRQTYTIPVEGITLVRAAVDVDQNIPQSKTQNRDAIAIVLGIEQYRNVPKANYARRDATVFKEYAVKILGVPDDKNHLYFKTDDQATQAELAKLFTENGWLARRVQPTSDVYVYYAGHGAPDLKGKQPYLIPFDGDPNYAPQTGFSLARLYDHLAQLEARSITVFLDACFSGGTRENTMLLADARPIFIRLENPVLRSKRMVVFAASSGAQISSGYPAGKHGLFTYFLLKGLRGAADQDQDELISVAELEAYLVLNVGETAIELDREQTPQVMGQNKERVLVRY